MTTHAPTANTTYQEPCPDCYQTHGTRWVDSTPDTDTWSCHGCGAEWTITVHVPGGQP